MTHRSTTRDLATLLLAVAVMLALAGLAAAPAPASEGGMSVMSGMTDAEMDAAGHTQEEPAAAGASGHGGETAAHGEADGQTAGAPQHMDMGGAVNWFVIGAFLAIVAGATLAAMATKRRLRRRMATGELATAGVQHV